MPLDMDAMGRALTKKLGPLPAWGWGIVIGGTGLAMYFILGKGKGAAAAAESGDLADATSYLAYPSTAASGGGGSSGDTGSDAGTTTPDATDVSGYQDQIDALTAQLGEEKAATQKAQESAEYQKKRAAGWKSWGIGWKGQSKRNARKLERQGRKAKPKAKPKTTPKRKPDTRPETHKRNSARGTKAVGSAPGRSYGRARRDTHPLQGNSAARPHAEPKRSRATNVRTNAPQGRQRGAGATRQVRPAGTSKRQPQRKR